MSGFIAGLVLLWLLGKLIKWVTSPWRKRRAARRKVGRVADYRLTQEDCDPGVTPTIAADEPMNKDRVNVVRGMLGLPPATDDELRRGIEAATADMVKAISFVRSNARACSSPCCWNWAPTPNGTARSRAASCAPASAPSWSATCTRAS